MIYTAEEIKELEKIRSDASLRRPKADVKDQKYWVDLLTSNVHTTPLLAAEMINKGQYHVAKSMLEFTISGMNELNGLANGVLRYEFGKGSVYVETGELYTG